MDVNKALTLAVFVVVLITAPHGASGEKDAIERLVEEWISREPKPPKPTPAQAKAELPNSLFGITLGASFDSLKGNKTKGAHPVAGAKDTHDRFVLDTGIYAPDKPLSVVQVLVDKTSRKVVGVIGMGFSAGEAPQCQKELKNLYGVIEKKYGELTPVQAGSKTYYMRQSGDRMMSASCISSSNKQTLYFQLSVSK
jgi:hypothetical protein